MRGKQTFFINHEALSRPPNYSNEEDLNTINFLKMAFNNPNALYNKPKEGVLELMSQMDEQQIIDSIDTYKTNVILYKKINAQANQYFTENPARGITYRLARELLTRHENASEYQASRSEFGETIKNSLGFNDPVNFTKTIIANYEDMQEILKLSSQLIEKCIQNLVILGKVQDEKSSGNTFGM